jgi:hypothetical protein
VYEGDRGISEGRSGSNRAVDTMEEKRINPGRGYWSNNVTNISDQEVSSLVYEVSFKNNVTRRLMVVAI